MTMFSEMAHYRSADWWRYAGFVLLNVAMATGGTYYIIQSMPPLRGEIPHFVPPMGMISFLLFACLYPFLRRMSPGLPRFLTLYGAFNAALVGLSLYFVVAGLLLGSVSLMPIDEFLRHIGTTFLLVVGCGHMYGFVFLLGIAAVNRLVSRLFFPRFALSS